MPGALDVLVEIQFSANDSVLKEINSQLEKESNILKTIEERLKQLNSAASGQVAVGAQLKLVNKEIAETNRLLVRMQSSYKEVDYAAKSLAAQKTGIASFVAALREAPEGATAFKAGLFEAVGQMPSFISGVEKMRGATEDLTTKGKPAMSFISALGATFRSTNFLVSAGVTGLTLYIEYLYKQGAVARQVAADNRAYAKSMAEIKQATLEQNIDMATHMETLYNTATNKNLGPNIRNRAVADMQAAAPGTLGSLDAEMIKEGEYSAEVQKTIAIMREKKQCTW